MLLDTVEQSRLALVRESGSLVLGGLRERRALAARAGSRRLVADACCQAVMIFLMLWLISALNTQGIAGASRQLLVQDVVAVAILACALVGYERIAALGGLGALIAYGPLGPHIQLVGLARVLVPIACLLVMVRAPQRRPRDPRQLLWLLPVCVAAALHAQADVSLPEALAVMSLGGLLRLFHDPRSAIACSLVWITLLSGHAGRPFPAGLGLPVVLAAVAAGLMLTVAAGRLWIMRHRATA
ncbi:MAG: hypothetical protein ACRDL5_13995 [Solirubrobacteraceae bacterium]